VIEKAEAEAAKKKTKRKRTVRSRTPGIEPEVDEVIEDIYSGSDDECSVVAARRQIPAGSIQIRVALS
jgi:hypothetical protein